MIHNMICMLIGYAFGLGAHWLATHLRDRARFEIAKHEIRKTMYRGQSDVFAEQIARRIFR